MMFNTIFKTPWAIHNKPEVMLGLGIGLGIGGAVATAVGTVKAVKAVEKRKKEVIKEEKLDIEPDEIRLSNKEVLTLTWKYYILPVACEIGSICLVIGCYKEQAKRISVLAAAYSATDASYRELKDKIKEKFGEKKEQLLQQEIDEKKEEERKKTDRPEEIIFSGEGNTLIRDGFTGQRIVHDLFKIMKIQDRLNNQLLQGYEDFINCNELLGEIGFEPCDKGDYFGFDASHLIDIRTISVSNENTMFPSIVVLHYDVILNEKYVKYITR